MREPTPPIPPAPPGFLMPAAKDEWWRVAPQLHVLGLLTAIDVMVLAAYCQACGRWQQAEDALAAMAERDPESGALTVTTGTGSLMQNPMLRVALSANSCCLISFSSRRFFVSLRPPATNTSTLFST